MNNKGWYDRIIDVLNAISDMLNKICCVIVVIVGIGMTARG